MAMTMAPPQFATLEYTPQPLYTTRASQQWNTNPNIRSHQEAPQEVEGVENRELPLLQEMRRFSWGAPNYDAWIKEQWALSYLPK